MSIKISSFVSCRCMLHSVELNTCYANGARSFVYAVSLHVCLSSFCLSSTTGWTLVDHKMLLPAFEDGDDSKCR